MGGIAAKIKKSFWFLVACYLFPVTGFWLSCGLSILMMAALQFEVNNIDKESKARAGKITTNHDEILTPIFMPLGTLASVKTITHQQSNEEVKEQIILGITYHLYLRPTLYVL